MVSPKIAVLTIALSAFVAPAVFGRAAIQEPGASASAATVHHPRHHVIALPREAFLGYAVPRWAYAAAGPAVRYHDTPSYDDPSKSGGGEALPIKN